MSVLWTTIGVLLVLMWVVSIVDLFRRHLGAGRTAAWLLIVILVPVIGVILYWALRKPSQEEIERQLASSGGGAVDPAQRLRDPRRMGS